MLEILGMCLDRVPVLEETHTSKESVPLWPHQLAESNSGDGTRPVGTRMKSYLYECSKLANRPLFLN